MSETVEMTPCPACQTTRAEPTLVGERKYQCVGCGATAFIRSTPAWEEYVAKNKIVGGNTMRWLATSHPWIADRAVELAAEPRDDDMMRVNGDVVCETCGQPYRLHPYDPYHLTDDHVGHLRPFLRAGCDGRLLKL